MIWIFFATVFFAIAVICIAHMRRRPADDLLSYGVVGIASIFMSAHSLLAFARAL